MRALNQAGVADWQLPAAGPLVPEELRRLLATPGVPRPVVLDVRSPADFSEGHVPAAVNVGTDPMLPTWVGSLLPHDTPLVLVLDGARQWGEVVTGLARIGHERVLGHLEGGITAWSGAGLPLARVAQSSVDELAGRIREEPVAVLDVRTDAEWGDGHIAGARHIALNDLPGRIDEVRAGATVSVICATGYRSSIATSLLLRGGRGPVVNIVGGMDAWYTAGYPTTAEHGETESADEVRA